MHSHISFHWLLQMLTFPVYLVVKKSFYFGLSLQGKTCCPAVGNAIREQAVAVSFLASASAAESRSHPVWSCAHVVNDWVKEVQYPTVSTPCGQFAI